MITLIAHRAAWGAGIYRDHLEKEYYITSWHPVIEKIDTEVEKPNLIKSLRLETVDKEFVDTDQLRGWMMMEKWKATGVAMQ